MGAESKDAPPASLGPPASFGHTVERRPILMGTMARLVVAGPSRAESLEATREIERILRSAEAELSTWKPGTELDRLNRASPDRPVELVETVASELSRALRCAAATHGAFDPTLGALVAAWDLRGEGRAPAEEELQEALRRSGWRQLQEHGGAWHRASGVTVDEGGFGKGAALDRVGRWLSDTAPGRVLVDLGGQILLFDPRGDGPPWPVSVAHPDDRQRPVLRLALPHGSVATSGNGERARASTGGAIGHLLDPRTGRPAADFGSVTVWAPTALEADCLATGLFVAGPDTALALAESHPGIEVLVIERREPGLSARASAGLRERIEWVAAELSLQGGPFGAPQTDLPEAGRSESMNRSFAEQPAGGHLPCSEPEARKRGGHLLLSQHRGEPRGGVTP